MIFDIDNSDKEKKWRNGGGARTILGNKICTIGKSILQKLANLPTISYKALQKSVTKVKFIITFYPMAESKRYTHLKNSQEIWS